MCHVDIKLIECIFSSNEPTLDKIESKITGSVVSVLIAFVKSQRLVGTLDTEFVIFSQIDLKLVV